MRAKVNIHYFIFASGSKTDWQILDRIISSGVHYKIVEYSEGFYKIIYYATSYQFDYLFGYLKFNYKYGDED